MTAQRQTFVTCLFDIHRRDPVFDRNVDFYVEHGRLVLDLAVPLVIYADPELAPWVRAERQGRGLDGLTLLVERRLEELAAYSSVELIRDLPTFLNIGPEKDTCLHQIIQWSKFDLLDEVIASNPFHTNHFAWIDFGVGHIASAPVTLPEPSDRVAVLQMRPVAAAEVQDRREFYKYERGRLAGGFFRGGRDAMLALGAAFRAELATLFTEGSRTNEQAVLNYLSARNPELFSFYYGDYPSVLTNWDFIRADLSTVFLNLRHSREFAMWENGLAVCQAIERSVEAGALTLTIDERAHWLDEHLIAAYYAGQIAVAQRTARQLVGECMDSSWFTEHRERILRNLSFVPLHAGGPEGVPERRPSGTTLRLTGAPLVSVIVPVHNGAHTLERAVRSALEQTWQRLEVIIVDDASTDGSTAVAAQLARADVRVRAFSRAAPSGRPGAARDDAVAASSGEYIALLDQDDWWLPDKLELQLSRFQSTGAAVVYGDAYRAVGDPPAGYELMSAPVGGRLPEGDISAELLERDCVPALTAVIRREWVDRVGRFDKHELVGVDDYYYWLRIALAGGSFAAVAEPIAVYVDHDGGLGKRARDECARSEARMRAALAREFPNATAPVSIALCMIVRNEAAVIERCLASVRNLITSWVIVDTGSTDDTVARITRALAGIPGQLHRRPWRDFGSNRTELLRLARGAADYLLLIDADMTVEQSTVLRHLDADAYLVRQRDAVEYWIPRLVRGDQEWRYEGVTHEYLEVPDGRTQARLPDLRIAHHGDGGSRADKLDRDKRLLERRLRAAPDDERATFYLAQTYEGLGDTQRAIELYRRRSELGGWEEESWYAAYRAASLEAIGDWYRGVAALLAAWNRRPSRVEPLYEVTRGYRIRSEHQLAYLFGERARRTEKPDDILFVHPDPYEWGALFEWSIAAYWVGDMQGALDACDELLRRRLPEDIALFVRRNRRHALAALGLTESGRPRTFPIARPDELRRLDQILDEVEIISVLPGTQAPWSEFNPSIAEDGDGFRMLVRSANYVEENGSYRMVDGAVAIRNRYMLVSLDHDLRVIDTTPVIDRSNHGGIPDAPVQGFEDCRLFSFGDAWFALGMSRESTPDYACTQVLLAMDGASIVSSRLLDGPDPSRDEKNWMPVTTAALPRVLYSCEPTVLLEIDPTTGLVTEICRQPAPASAGAYRGGSQGVVVETGTLFVVHEVTGFGTSRVYSHRFVLFDETWQLTAVSPPFCFLEAGVEFCAGMARRGNDLVLSFGVRDRRAHLAVVPWARVRSLLHPPSA